MNQLLVYVLGVDVPEIRELEKQCEEIIELNYMFNKEIDGKESSDEEA